MSEKVLIMGLPGAGKTTLGTFLAETFDWCAYLDADDVRRIYNDWNFTAEGRVIQARRMNGLVSKMNHRIGLAGFVCPMKETRMAFDPALTVWMDTIGQGRFEDTNKMFEKPDEIDNMIIVDRFLGMSEMKKLGEQIYERVVELETNSPDARKISTFP